MSKKKEVPNPQRILQIYDPESQANFRGWSLLDKLEWLEAINRLYWAGRLQKRQEKAA